MNTWATFRLGIVMFLGQLALILWLLILSTACTVSNSGKGEESVQRFVDTSISGDTFGSQFGIAGSRGAEAAIRSQPALAWKGEETWKGQMQSQESDLAQSAERLRGAMLSTTVAQVSNFVLPAMPTGKNGNSISSRLSAPSLTVNGSSPTLIVMTDAWKSLSNMQEMGYLRSQSSLAWSKTRAARLIDHQGQEWAAGEPFELSWRGLVILPDLSVVYLDPEMAATQASVSLQESTWRCDAHRTTDVAGVIYEVLGLFQLLYDSSMQRLTESMGYTKADLLTCKPNALVAQEWKRLTDKGMEWRLWVAKPQYRTDKSLSYGGY